MKREILLNWRIYFAAPLVVAWLHASLNYSGFCFKEMRYLSDREKFRIVFEALNFKKTLRVEAIGKDNLRFFKPYKRIKYESFEQFMEMNPDCCKVANSGKVVMNFTLRYLDENGDRRAQEVTVKGAIKNCGNIKGNLDAFPKDGLDFYLFN